MIILFGGLWGSFFIWSALGFVQHRHLQEKVRLALGLEAQIRGKISMRLAAAGEVLSGRRARRRKQCRLQFPDFLDLLALGLSAGLTLERAWAAALSHLPPSLFINELNDVRRAWDMGRTRRQALEELRARTDDPSASMVLSLIAQALERGGPLEEILRSQSQALRRLRFLAVEKRAQTAGLRLLFPIFVFIFPTVFLILFAPLFLRFSQGVALF